MSKPIFTLSLLLIATGLSACAEQPAHAGSSSDEQRNHAQTAQDELSSEVHK